MTKSISHQYGDEENEGELIPLEDAIVAYRKNRSNFDNEKWIFLQEKAVRFLMNKQKKAAIELFQRNIDHIDAMICMANDRIRYMIEADSDKESIEKDRALIRILEEDKEKLKVMIDEIIDMVIS